MNGSSCRGPCPGSKGADAKATTGSQKYSSILSPPSQRKTQGECTLSRAVECVWIACPLADWSCKPQVLPPVHPAPLPWRYELVASSNLVFAVGLLTTPIPTHRSYGPFHENEMNISTRGPNVPSAHLEAALVLGMGPRRITYPSFDG